MDFFSQQDAARAASRKLAWLMALAVAATVVAVNVVVAIAFSAGGVKLHGGEQAGLHLAATIGTLLLIGGGSLWKTLELSDGGRSVALALGGREVQPSTRDPDERRFLNVVEEMALASGVPVPPAYLLDEDGINAFAAGWAPGDAVVAVTRGALATLSRDQLQGVIAHEFSHILNQDCRINLRLMGLVHGILVLALTGRFLLRSLGRSRGGGKKGGGLAVVVVIALGLLVVGAIGWFFGQLIRAAVSRQREFLADASAVQFTRNPAGIAGALKQVLAGASGSRIAHERAPEASHMFFGAVGASAWTSALATHPPLPERIRRLDPQWDGKLPPPGRGAEADAPPPAAAGFAGGGRRPFAAAQVVERAGSSPDPARIAWGAGLLRRLPTPLAAAAREPFAARAVALVLLIERAPGGDAAAIGAVRAIDPALAPEMERLLPAWRGVDPDAARLPLLQLAAPALAQLTPAQARHLLSLVGAAIAADGRIGFGEFCAARLLRARLGRRPPAPATLTRLALARDELVAVFGAMARVGAPADEAAAGTAFAAGWDRLFLAGDAPRLPPLADCTTVRLDAALDRLRNANGAIKRRIIDGLAHCIAADGACTNREAELLRVVCEDLEVPMPPFGA